MKQLFVPGRLCLFGEHSDWAGYYRMMNPEISSGMAIIMGTDQGIYATVEKCDRLKVQNTSEQLKGCWQDFDCEMNLAVLKEVAASNSFFAYIAGVASYVHENYNVKGLYITITEMTLPIKSGLSSSAAICVLVARAFNQLYSLNLSLHGEMTLAYRGELRTLSRCGRMDQACAFGNRPVLMEFDGDEVKVDRIAVKNPLYWVFANLKAHKDTKKILSDLNTCYPYARSEIEASVQSYLGNDNFKIVSKAVEFIKNGEAEKLGALMTQAQKLFDDKVMPASYDNLRAPLLHKVLNDDEIKSLTFGGKGVGSQGDGSVQFLAKSEACQKELVNKLNARGYESYPLTITPRHKINKAVIPVAGFGTRLYPATRTMKKEFMPIIDKDGLVKPVILMILEHLYDSGIEEICLIVGNDQDILQYENYFNKPLMSEHINKLPLQVRDYENKILDIGKKLYFCIQKERRGFGHAVYQSKAFCNGEAVLLLLGDVFYRSRTGKTCSSQLIESFETLGKPLIGMHEIPLENVIHYGVLRGEWEDKDEKILNVEKFVEKPTVVYARDFLGMERQKKTTYLSVFGQYIINSDVFEKLEESINNYSEDSVDEIGLTEAISATQNGIYGVLLDGDMYDIGNPDSYMDAIRMY